MNEFISPVITIITSTWNCAEDLKLTANSIREQTYKNIQWIVADGGSSDGTVDIIVANQDIVTDWFSESDGGIYDAWNKACKYIAGDWVIFLGAGDVFCSSATLEQVMRKMAHLPCGVVASYGGVLQSEGGHIIYRFAEVDLDEWELYRPRLPCHQGVFQRYFLFNVEKPFDDSYRVVADSKFLLEAAGIGDFFFLDVDVCNMLPGGVSAHPSRALVVMHEFLRLESEIGYKIPIKNKMLYVFISYFKYCLFNLGGHVLLKAL